MEEILMRGEQPIEKDEQTLVQEEHLSVQDTLIGSPINKFKTTLELQKAYENLEREYTKKCQKLSSLEKELDNAKAPNKQENVLALLNEFCSENPKAKDFHDKLLNKGLEKADFSKDSLMKDYIEILGQAYENEKEKNSSSELLFDKVINDDNLKNKIIGDYIEKVKQNKVAPLIKAGDGSYVITPNAIPKTLNEANDLARQILK